MYFFNPISDEVRLARLNFHKKSKTMRLILGSIFACMAAVLQSAGGFLPGVGYFISPLATAPVMLCSMLSLPIGIITYFLTMILLLILQPSELIVFPFTTGLLGLGIGASCYFFKKRISIIVGGAVLLLIGIMKLLYVFHFPVLGPVVTDSFSFLTIGMIFLFAFFYSWLWVESGLLIFKRMKGIIPY